MVNDRRPDPEELLRDLSAADRRAARGRLTVFLGYAPGVGKTYAMLLAARAECAAGRRTLVGVVETHGRAETEALLAELDVLPRRAIDHRGIKLAEFDLDGALAARPELILLDELAHANAEGSRHAKRWQDAAELLDNGIDVFTTLNVQHLESLHHVVAQVTGVSVRETVPDSAIEDAHEIRLVDLPPEELLERLAAGKVYVPDQAKRAIERFFNRGNLIALRGLALRQTAERVDAEMGAYRRAHGIEQTWAVTDRILVGVSPSPYSARLVRAACRMARSLHVPWFAVYVETTTQAELSAAARQRLSQNLRLAEQLGAETLTITGLRAAPALLELARERNVTKIVVGKPRRWRWRERAPGAFISELMLESGDIDILVTTGEDEAAAPAAQPPPRRGAVDWLGYALAFGAVAAATVVGLLLLGRREPADAVMLFLLAVVIVSLRRGRGPSVAAAALGVLAFDYFFIPPFLSLSVADVRHLLTFSVMMLVAAVISSLAGRARVHADQSRQRERRTALLFGLSRELAAATDPPGVLEIAARRLGQVFDGPVGFQLADELGLLNFTAAAAATDPPLAEGIVRWVWENAREAGASTDTMAGAKGLYLPLRAAQRAIGVLAVFPRSPRLFDDPEQSRLLDALGSQVALALERLNLAAQSQRALLAAEQERLRGTLLSSVSHDLRTPLAAITGAASALLEAPDGLSADGRRELLLTIHEEARRLNRLVRNLLDMTRVESGAIEVKREWQPLDEVVGAALRRLEDQLAGREVALDLPADLPLAPIDGMLIEQVLVNLLENAVKYTPAASPIDIAGRSGGGELIVEVADRGPGLAAGEEARVFEKFYRSPLVGRTGGAGLGLAICQAIVVAHGGEISAANRDGGGAAFRFSLPIVGEPPKLDNDGPAGAE